MTNQKQAGLQFQRQFTREGENVFEMFEYDYRVSVIRNPNGEVVFEMNNVEVPKQWSQIATDIIAQKYFRKAGVPQPDGSLGRETSAKQVAVGKPGENAIIILLRQRMPRSFMRSWFIVSSTRPVFQTALNGSIPAYMKAMESRANHRVIIMWMQMMMF